MDSKTPGPPNRTELDRETVPGFPILVAGRTCWRVARARRMAVVVDAAAYFALIKAAILEARHTVMLIGWDFDTRIKLEPENPAPGVPDELGSFLCWIVRERPELRINVLKWDLSFLKMPFRGRTPLVLLDWMSSRRLRFRLDSAHPAGACHHQKIAIIDDALAFCGGIDMTTDRWDTPEHRDDDPRRIRPSGRPYGPFHDVTTAVDGDAARVLGDLARERWRRATGEELEPPPPTEACWPAGLKPDFEDVPVAVARTDPMVTPAGDGYDGGAGSGVREIEALYLAAIAGARRFIYLESQYFASLRIAEALMARLAEPEGPEIVVVNPKHTLGWLEEKAMGTARDLLVERVRAADRHGRFRILAPVTEGGHGIYVHAKVLVVDDRFLRVGSSNINNRSMGLDTECDLAVEAAPEAGDDAAVRQAIRSVRTRLMAEHLGVGVREVEHAEETGASLVTAVDRLMRRSGRTLVPLEPDPVSDAERHMVETRLLDPDRPEAMAGKITRGISSFPEVDTMMSRIGIALAAGLGLISAAAYRVLQSRRLGQR